MPGTYFAVIGEPIAQADIIGIMMVNMKVEKITLECGSMVSSIMTH
jgi:hypothetical protein